MKLLFSDLDGTLLNDKKEITPLTRQSLDQWYAAGHKLILCSGRPLPSMLEVKKQLLSDYPGMYLIGFNGGLIYDCDAQRMIYRACLPLTQVSQILKAAADCGIHCHTYGDECILTPTDNIHLAFYRKTIHMPCHVIKHLPDALLDGSLTELPGTGASAVEGPCKCLAVEVISPARLQQLHDRLLELPFSSDLQLLPSSKYLLEIIPSFSGKGTAVHQLCDLLGVDIRESIAAGDQVNDISMLQAAGTSIAMLNGMDTVKKAATMVTAFDNNHDGLGRLLMDLC